MTSQDFSVKFHKPDTSSVKIKNDLSFEIEGDNVYGKYSTPGKLKLEGKWTAALEKKWKPLKQYLQY